LDDDERKDEFEMPATERLFGSAALIAAVLVFPALAQVENWNTNADAVVDRGEYRGAMTGFGFFDKWDTNGDDMLSEQEFEAGMEQSNIAFVQRFGRNIHPSWDTDDDGLLHEDEMYDGAFDSYDSDRNEMLEEPELGNIADDLGD
jgi:hypothetical protein